MVPASLGVVAFPGAASAATPTGSTTCGGISLKISGGKALLTLTKCGDTDEHGRLGFLNAADLVPKGAQKVVFDWANKGTTSATMTVKVGGTKCAKGSTEYVATGKVTKDTGKASSLKVGNAVGAEICSTATHAISFVKGTVFTI